MSLVAAVHNGDNTLHIMRMLDTLKVITGK